MHGPGWDRGRGLRTQDAWDEHAEFMDRLTAEGFVVLGGPLGADRALLVIEAPDVETVHRTLDADPWTAMGLLVTDLAEPWEVLLDHARS